MEIQLVSSITKLFEAKCRLGFQILVYACCACVRNPYLSLNRKAVSNLQNHADNDVPGNSLSQNLYPLYSLCVRLPHPPDPCTRLHISDKALAIRSNALSTHSGQFVARDF